MDINSTTLAHKIKTTGNLRLTEGRRFAEVFPLSQEFGKHLALSR